METALTSVSVSGGSQTYSSMIVDTSTTTYYPYIQLLQVFLKKPIMGMTIMEFTTLVMTEVQTQYAGQYEAKLL